MHENPLVLASTLGGGDVAVAINRPYRSNSLSAATLDALLLKVQDAATRKARVLVLSGVGSHFSAGADLDEMQGTAADQAWLDRMEVLTRALRTSPVISIAAVSGACLGAGLEIALACDVRVADASAYFGMPAVGMGLLYAPEAINRLVALIGEVRAQRLLLIGDRLTAEAAFEVGLLAQLGADAAAGAEVIRGVIRARPEAAFDTLRCLSAISPESREFWYPNHRASIGRPERRAAVSAARAALKGVAQ